MILVTSLLHKLAASLAAVPACKCIHGLWISAPRLAESIKLYAFNKMYSRSILDMQRNKTSCPGNVHDANIPTVAVVAVACEF